jgi:hypothetical protein
MAASGAPWQAVVSCVVRTRITIVVDIGHQLSWTDTEWPTASDCLLPFDFDLPNHAGCRKRTVAVFSANGWAVSNEEFSPGVVGCAVPIRLPNGKLLAGLGVSVPSARTSFEKVTAFLPSLKAATREIAASSDDCFLFLGVGLRSDDGLVAMQC